MSTPENRPQLKIPIESTGGTRLTLIIEHDGTLVDVVPTAKLEEGINPPETISPDKSDVLVFVAPSQKPAVITPNGIAS